MTHSITVEDQGGVFCALLITEDGRMARGWGDTEAEAREALAARAPQYDCDGEGCAHCAAPAPAAPAARGTYMDYLPEDGKFSEDDLWDAIAEANGLDASEIMDGDLAEWL